MWRILGPDIATAGFQAEKQKPDSISTCLLTIWSSHMWRPENIRNGWQQQLTPRQRNKKNKFHINVALITPLTVKASLGTWSYWYLLRFQSMWGHIRWSHQAAQRWTVSMLESIKEFIKYTVYLTSGWVLKLTCIHVLCSEINKLEWLSLPWMKYSVIDISLIWHYEATRIHISNWIG